VSEDLRACARHPAVFAYAVGNEIPAPVVRWYGARPVEHHLRELYLDAKHADPVSLVTYVNYPSTEYLDLPFLDFVSFNVYLESRRTLRACVARLQNLAGDRPLLMAKVGLDSARNGEAKQARVLRWQLRTLARGGCAGACLFSWTDEWHRGGEPAGADQHDHRHAGHRLRKRPAQRKVNRANFQCRRAVHPAEDGVDVVGEEVGVLVGRQQGDVADEEHAQDGFGIALAPLLAPSARPARRSSLSRSPTA
jgi:hypothetical protein